MQIDQGEVMSDKLKKLFVFMSLFSFLIAANAVYAVSVDKINVNSASVEQLQELPGVGPVTAERIVAYRDKTPFSTPEQLMEVKGIGAKTFAKMKDFIAVE
jgi:competence protein ComEA